MKAGFMAGYKKTGISAVDVAILLLLAIIWGSAFGAIKLAVEATAPLTIAASRSVLAFLSIGLVVIFRLGVAGFLAPLVNPRLMFIGITGTFAPFVLISWAELHIASSQAGLLMASGPFVTMIGGHFITRDEQMTPLRVTGVLTGLVGVSILFWDGVQSLGSSSVLAQLALIFAACCYASSNLSVRAVSHLSPLQIAASSFFISAVISLPLALALEQPRPLSWSAEIWAALLWLGVISTAFAFSLRYVLIARAGAGFMSNVGYLIPLVAAMIGWLVLDEPVDIVTIVAMIIIIISIILAQRSGTHFKDQPERA